MPNSSPQHFSYATFLASKQSVDARSLNGHVWKQLIDQLGDFELSEPLQIVEVGCGLGQMCSRLLLQLQHEIIHYYLVDELEEHVELALYHIQERVEAAGLACQQVESGIRISGGKQTIRVVAVVGDVLQTALALPKADLLIAQAFLDLFDLDVILGRLSHLIKAGGLAYFPINIDGITHFSPAIDGGLDNWVEEMYHASMFERSSAGPETGRALLEALPAAGIALVAVGGSDWVVHANAEGAYVAEEAYFLYHLLHYVEQEGLKRIDVDHNAFSNWLAKRRAQIETGELILMVHQLDFLGLRR